MFLPQNVERRLAVPRRYVVTTDENIPSISPWGILFSQKHEETGTETCVTCKPVHLSFIKWKMGTGIEI